jgi:MscS family membrane protein
MHDHRQSVITFVSRLLCVAIISFHAVPCAAQRTPVPQSASKKTTPPSSATLPFATQPAEQNETLLTPVPAPPLDSLGRSTPHGTVLGFLRAAEAQDYPRAARFLDSKLSEKQTEQLAIQLKALFDLNSSADLESISRSSKGNIDDALRISREKIGTIITPSGSLSILLDRIDRPNESPIWLFSQETLALVPAAYASTQHKDISHYFPQWTSRVRILSVPLWRWGIIAIALLLALVLAKLLARLVLHLLRLPFRHRTVPGLEATTLKLNGPNFGLILALLIRIGADYTITALGHHYWIVASVLTAAISTAWLLMRLVDIGTAFAVHRLFLQNQIERITAVGLVARLLKILIVIILGIFLMTMAGVNVSAVFAGLGIGGIALALAAQKTLADLFGGISIVMRGAVRVNDYCTVAGQTGTVEEIGISALRLRTLDRSIISIPNSKVAEMELENFTMRDQFWMHQNFILRFDTPHATVQRVLKDIATVLTSRADIDASTARVRIVQLAPSGPQIEVFAYFKRPGGNYNDFLEEQEKIILEIMRVVEEAGTSLTSPVGIIRLDSERPPSQRPAAR